MTYDINNKYIIVTRGVSVTKKAAQMALRYLVRSTPLFLLSSDSNKNIIMHVRRQRSRKMFKLLYLALVFGCKL